MMASLLDLVQSLETGLIDSKTASQKESLRTLVDGLMIVPIDTVQDEEVQCLVEFLTSRLAIADPDIICAILDGFIWLARTRRTDGTQLLSSTQAVRICKDGLFGYLTVQSLSKSPRLRVFRFLQLLLHSPQLAGLKTMGKAFVVSYVQAVDGEKDPECLTVIFDMNLVVMAHFELDEMQEDFFEIMAAYFPINFTPPPGDGMSGISRASLSEALHRCLFASRTFSGPYLLPLLCEKADSDWPQAQLDSLSLLADCLHGNLHSADKLEASRGPSIPLHHLASYLVLIAPLLEKMANKPISHKLDSFARACLTGLVHAYSSQTRETHRLKDFVAMLLKTFGIVLDELQKPTAPKLPSEQVQQYLLEAVRYSGSDRLLCALMVDYLLRYMCSPLLYWSSTEANNTPENIINVLEPWHSSFTLACRFLDASTESAHLSEQSSVVAAQVYRGTLNLLSTLHETLVVTSTRANSTEPKVPYELLVTLLGLAARLSSHDSAATTSSEEELNRIVQLFSLVVFRLDQKRPPSIPAISLDTIREELIAIVSHLYRAPFSPALEPLNTSLFEQIQATRDQHSSSCCLALDLLQHAALTNPIVMDRLFQFLFGDAGSTSAFSSAVGVLHFFAQSAVKPSSIDKCDLAVTRHLCDLLLGRLDFISQLMAQQSVPSVQLLESLGETFRIISGLAEDRQQTKLSEFWNSTSQPLSIYNPLPCVLFCSIITAFNQMVIETLNPLALMRKLIQSASPDTPPFGMEQSVFDYATATVAQAYASVLNKCPELLHSDVVSHVLETANQLWNEKLPPDGSERFACHWLVACLRSLLAHPGSSRRELFTNLSVIILRHPEKINQEWGFRIRALLDLLPELCSPSTPGGATSYICHWEETGLFPQKTLYLLTLPLVGQINNLSTALRVNSTPEERTSIERMRDSYLSAFLRLCLPLPTNLLRQHLKELIPFVLLAITSSRSLNTQTIGLRLFCSIVDCVKTDSGQMVSCLSTADIDDVFACLPRLAEYAAGRASNELESGDQRTGRQSSKTAALTRLSIARCLSSLVSLPAEIVGRHRDKCVLPVLARLLDDPSRAVRIEASKANNVWLVQT